MYYYFSSTLPYLHFDSPPPFSEEGFAELCREHLKPADRAAFEALVKGEDSAHSFVQAWRDFEVKLRNAVAKRRAAKLGVDASKWLRPQNGESPEIEHAVEAAFNEPDPLRRDTALKRLMWDKADELAGPDIFQSSHILSLHIRLRILAGRARHNPAAGRARLLQMTAEI